MDYRKKIDKYLSHIDNGRKTRGRYYKQAGRVEIKNIFTYKDEIFNVEAVVKGSHNTYYKLKLYIRDGEFGERFMSKCSCLDGSLNCKHVAATLYEIKENPKYLEDIEEEKKYQKGKNLIELIGSNNNKLDKSNELDKLDDDKFKYENTDEDEKILRLDVLDKGARLELKIYMPEHTVDVFLEVYIARVGNKSTYRIKDLILFFDRMAKNEYYMYNNKFGMVHSIDKFDDESKDILNFVLKHTEALRIATDMIDNMSSYRYHNLSIKDNRFDLSGIILDDFFNTMKGKEVEIKIGKKKDIIKIDNSSRDFKIIAEKINNEDYRIKTNINGNVAILDGYKHQYVASLSPNELILYPLRNRLNRSEFDILKMSKANIDQEILIKEKDMSLFVSNVLPKINKSFDASSIKGTSVEKLMPKELGVKVLLDYDKKGNIVLKPIYCYDNVEIDPFKIKNGKYESFRDILAEAKVEKTFKTTGFEIDEENGQYILKSNEDIYRFLTVEAELYMQKFEVLVTDEFKSKEIRRPKIGQLGVRVENDLLSVDFDKMNIREEDLVDVLKQYRMKKKYYRLKDGTFINLDNSKDLDIISDITENMNLDIKAMNNGNIKLPLYRSAYLNSILDNTENIDIIKDEKYKEIVDKVEDSRELEYNIPNGVKDILRHYQKVGYNWLKVIDEYKFGGILADDMGLGKTLQIISVILSYIESCQKSKVKIKPSIVICPSSLSLNWKNEITKFNAKINVLVIKGMAKERRELIKDIKNHQLVITSYDLIKRDIEEYIAEDVNFKYIIVDEAQYIKNSNTKNAKAIKRLSAETRYALTGTPIENSLAELWSIFDYILPGYLYGYSKFRDVYEMPIVKDENKQAMEKLKKLIAPFILRRLKKEVLTELPEKTISILSNEMEEEQLKIYNSYLIQARKQIKEELGNNSFEKSQIKILALLTRLRQVCCHPSLFIDNYKGESSKLIQCMELVKEAIESGHKILLFSQYTSMFEIIEKELQNKGIQYFKLTGNTKVEQRVKMVDEFNESEDIKVFLISLKAGGTGLNLTSADTVIHYDPWWNLSAENQATDRAYRIGQKNAVQVYKLITNSTIEEKIQKMQERKGKLIEDVLSNEETFINKLTKDEVMELFE